MAVKVAISGFGRIGRNVLRAIAEAKRTDVEVVAINDLVRPRTTPTCFKYDSVHGRFPGEVKVEGDIIDVGLRARSRCWPSAIPRSCPGRRSTSTS